MRLSPLLLLVLLPLGAAAAEADPLATLRPGHPRLLLTDPALAAALTAARTDPLRAALHARIIALAEAELTQAPIVHKLIGPRLLDQSRLAITRVLTGAMAFRLTGDRRFADRAKKEMLTAAAFADWNPSHFLDVAEMSFALGLGYDWLYAQLTPDERKTIKSALIEKGLAFAAPAYTPGSVKDKRLWWPTAHHNWNQVCNGGLLTAALALADEEPALARVVIAGVRASLPLAMDAYQPDGAYPEGPGYWGYGTTYNVIALASLESALGTDFALSQAPAFDRTVLYRLHVQSPTGLGFNYADGGAALGASATYTWLARRFASAPALSHSRELLADTVAKKRADRESDRFLALHAVWFPAPEDPAKEEAPLDIRFRGPAQLAIFRSAWHDPRALFLGFKAGGNAVNHSHLDLGSFVLDADGVRWAQDLGPDDYNMPGYFDHDRITSPRWTYFRLNNHGHNTVTPAGALQQPDATAPIIAFSSAPANAFAIADLTSAYPEQARSLHRGVALLDRARVLVQDEFTAVKSGIPLHWGLLTGAKIEISADGRTATLTQEGRTLQADLLAPAGARFSLGSTKPGQAIENQNKGTAMLAVEVTDATRLAVLLTPVGEHWPAVRPPPSLRPLAEWK